MATELTMPQMGYDMQEGTVVRWLKPEGSAVEMGEPIAEIETDKAVVEFESYASGILITILVPEGTAVPVGQPIALVGAEGEEVPERPAEAIPATVSESPAQPTAPLPVEASGREEAPRAARARQFRASPMARLLADERGIDLAMVKGTGPGHRITKDDVLGFEGAPAAAEGVVSQAAVIAQAPAPGPAAPPVEVSPSDRIPLSRMRQQIARVTVQSKREKPHFYVSSEIDMTQAMELRRQINEALRIEGIRVSVNDLIIKACVNALRKFPKFNASFQDEAIQMNAEINVGIAIAEKEGLIVPAILDCADKTLGEIAKASTDLAERAKSGTLRSGEYTGGTFGISNMGMFEVSSFVAIIHPPQTAMLAVGAVGKKPIVRDDEVTVAQVMTATLSCDHRVVDGAEGARFIIEVKRLLEHPASLLI